MLEQNRKKVQRQAQGGEETPMPTFTSRNQPHSGHWGYIWDNGKEIGNYRDSRDYIGRGLGSPVTP